MFLLPAACSPDAFNDRQFFLYNISTGGQIQIKDSNVLCLKPAFKAIRKAPIERSNYNFQHDRRQACNAAQNHLCDHKQVIPDDEERR